MLPATSQRWPFRLYPAKAGTRFSDPGGMQGWVDLKIDWLTRSDVYIGCHWLVIQACVAKEAVSIIICNGHDILCRSFLRIFVEDCRYSILLKKTNVLWQGCGNANNWHGGVECYMLHTYTTNTPYLKLQKTKQKTRKNLWIFIPRQH